MTGLAPHNMNLIESSFKKTFRVLKFNHINEDEYNNVYEESVDPILFTKVCVNILW